MIAVTHNLDVDFNSDIGTRYAGRKLGKMSGGNGARSSDTGSSQGTLSKKPYVRQAGVQGDRRKSDKVTRLRARQNSLRRVKDSTDMLRERSIRSQESRKGTDLNNNTPTRDAKAKKFTVANVGNNGKIYLG